MICPACRDLCARTEAQLENRRLNISLMPKVHPYPCTSCGGTDWATTDAMVAPEPPSMWRRLVDALGKHAAARARQ